MTAEPAPAVAVTVIGSAARHSLASAWRGVVLAVFKRALYIELEGGGLVCFGPRSLGAGPLNALCVIPEDVDWEALGPTPGTPVRVTPASIEVRGGPAFSLGEARDWHSPPPLDTQQMSKIGEGLTALAAAAREQTPTAGVAPLLADLATGGVCPTTTADPFLRLATGGATALRDWLVGRADGREEFDPPPPAEAAILIGLGPGLTPSGDDFIGGALIALRYLSRNQLADGLAEWALPLAAAGTGTISGALLACAAAGEGAEALHAMLAAVCAADKTGIAIHLPAVDAIGHCSGWDALAGIAAACAAVVERGDEI